MTNTIQWVEIIPGLTVNKSSDTIKFSVVKNESGSLSGVFYISKDILPKIGMIEGGFTKIFENPEDNRQFLLKACSEHTGYKVSKLGGKNKFSSFVRVNFRLTIRPEDLQERDYRSRKVKHIINEEDSSLLVNTSWND